jgi:glycine betaine/proline transport system substrate-binding protein
MVRKGLKEDQPEAYKVLDNFHWSEKDMEKVMLEINNGKDPQQAAKEWIKENQELVESWKK